MTISSEVTTAGPYDGNGVTTIFPYDFRIVEEEHIRVVLRDAFGVSTDLSLVGGDFTVTGVGNVDGGNVIVAVPPTVGQKLTLLRSPPLTQETDLANQGPYSASVVEDRFDMLVMQIQTVNEKTDRAITAAPGQTPPSFSLIEAAESNATAAAASAVLAGQRAQNSLESATLSAEFANNPEDVPVMPGLYSAFHFMKKAAAYATTAFTKAQEWATSMSLVDGVDYSAKYYANRAYLNGSVPIGTIIDVYGNGTTTPPGYLKVIPGLEITSAYPELRTWALANGWAVNGSGNPVYPSTDDALFKRQWRPGQTLRDVGRVFGTVELDAFQGHWHRLDGINNGQAGGAAANPGGTGNTRDDRVLGPVTDGVNGTPRTATETRPANITVTWFIKAYDAPVDTATLTAAQVLSDLADAKARVALLGIKNGAAVVNPNTSAVLFAGIPTGVKRITAHMSGLAGSSPSNPVVRLGSGGAIQSSGYVGPVSVSNGGSAIITTGDTTGVILLNANGTGSHHGKITFERLSPSSNIWDYYGVISYTGVGQSWVSGSVTLAGEPDRLQFTTIAGAVLLNGTVNISWEF